MTKKMFDVKDHPIVKKAIEDRPLFSPGKIIKTDKPVEVVDPQGGDVKAWSASTLKKFDNCPYSVYLGKVKKIKEESGEAANRGSRIHDLAEHYVDGTIGELPEELKKFTTDFEELREKYNNAQVTLEQDWGFDIDWAPTGWVDKDVWGRMKLDALVEEDGGTSAVVIDYKTGRKFGNEIDHNRQALIYTIGTFMRFPDLEFIRSEFWYLDQGEYLRNTYTREQAMVLMPRVHNRAVRLTSCTDFKPKPSRDACKWCSYKFEHCNWGYIG